MTGLPPSGWVALVGNPRPGSRTAGIAAALLSAIASLPGVSPADDHVPSGAPAQPGTLVDLADLLGTLGAPLGPDSGARYAEPLRLVTSARLLVVATPTYKGSYTGLLKSFLDHVGAGQLRGAVAIPVTTVGSPAHTLAADVHLRPLLLELGASTPTGALVVGEDQLGDPEAAVQTWLEVNAAALVGALGGALGVAGSPGVVPT